MDMFETKWYFVFSLLVLKVSHPEAPHFPVHLQCLPPSSIPHAKLEPHLQVPSKTQTVKITQLLRNDHVTLNMLKVTRITTGPEFPTSLVVVYCFVSWFKVRDGCSFSWYWWNCWPSLFKLWYSCCSIFRFLCSVLQIVVCPFALFLLAIVLSVLSHLRLLITSLVSSNLSFIMKTSYYLNWSRVFE